MSLEIQAAYSTGRTVYALIRSFTGLVWNGSSFVSYATANLGTYAITLGEQGTASGYYAGTFPSTIVTGHYNLTAYLQVGSSPAEGDPVIATGDMDWTIELTGVPAAAPSLAECLMFLYMALRNKLTVTATQEKLNNNAGSTVATSTLSDDGTTFTRGQFS